MANVAVDLDEGAGVEQLEHALAGEQPAALPSARHRLRAALVERLVAEGLHARELLGGGLVHGGEPNGDRC
jgi:hypothetical protein